MAVSSITGSASLANGRASKPAGAHGGDENIAASGESLIPGGHRKVHGALRRRVLLGDLAPAVGRATERRGRRHALARGGRRLRGRGADDSVMGRDSETGGGGRATRFPTGVSFETRRSKTLDSGNVFDLLWAK
jgi:hypothetical protein